MPEDIPIPFIYITRNKKEMREIDKNEYQAAINAVAGWRRVRQLLTALPPPSAEAADTKPDQRKNVTGADLNS